MKAYLASTIYGCFLVDSTGKVVKALRCSPNDQSAISKLLEGVEKLGIEKVETIEPELARFAQACSAKPKYSKHLLTREFRAEFRSFKGRSV